MSNPNNEIKKDWGKYAWIGVFAFWIIPALCLLVKILTLVIIFIMSALAPSGGAVPELPAFLLFLFVGGSGALATVVGDITILFAIILSIVYMICWIVYMVDRKKSNTGGRS